MALTFLEPPTSNNPSRSIELSQQAPAYLKSQASWSLPYPLSLLVTNESQEKWQSYENMLVACLRTGDYASASKILEEMTDRFGVENDRVLALRGLYKEVTAKDQSDLDAVLKQYEDLLSEDASVFTIRKRRIALLRSMGRLGEAVTALTRLLDHSPTDAEAWAELADCYLSQGAFEQAVFCLEEVLLLSPNAWNIHAKLGEVIFLSAPRVESGADPSKALAESLRRFCRSIELCDNYLRGYYGLKIASSRLLDQITSGKKTQQSSEASAGDLPLPSIATVKKLNELATAKLAEILRRSSSGERDWDGYSPIELAAARALLDKETQKIER